MSVYCSCVVLVCVLFFFTNQLDYNDLCSERFPLPLCAWDRLRYFIVALPGPSIELFFIYCMLILYHVMVKYIFLSYHNDQ